MVRGGLAALLAAAFVALSGCAGFDSGGSGTIGPAGGSVRTSSAIGLSGAPRARVTIPEGQLADWVFFELRERLASEVPPLTQGVAVGGAFTFEGSGTGTPLALGQVTWQLACSFDELAAAAIAVDDRESLALYAWNAPADRWDLIPSSNATIGSGRVDIAATFASSTTATIRAGLPPGGTGLSIRSLTADRKAVPRGGSALLTCDVSNPDGEVLTYTWEADRGTIVGSGATATWTTQADYGMATVRCAVRTASGRSRSRSLALVSAHTDTTPASLDGGVCVLCFDDGNTGDLPAFEYMYGRYGMMATCFLQSNRLGTGYAATPTQYSAMASAGWQMGNHTTTGVVLTSQSGSIGDKIAATVLPAQSQIQEALDLPEAPTVFAPPQGILGLGTADEDAMADALLDHFPTIRGTYSTYYQFPLQHLSSVHYAVGEVTHWLDAWSMASFDELSITVGKHLIDLAADNNGLAIIHTHNITDTPSRYDMTTADFRDLVDYIAASGVHTLTFEQLYDLRGRWPSGPRIADGGFTRQSELWTAAGRRWPGGGNGEYGTMYLPWQPSEYGSGIVTLDPSVGRAAAGSGCVHARSGGPFYLHQRMSLEPNRRYRASGWIRTQGLTGGSGARLANAGVSGSEVNAPSAGIAGTTDWTRVEDEFVSPRAGGLLVDVDLWLQVDATSGTAWFDDIEVVPVS